MVLNRKALLCAVVVALAAGGVPSSSVAEAVARRAPLECSEGPDGQVYEVVVRNPSSAEAGSRFTVRLEGVHSGEISPFGLDYIHDMATDFRVPESMRYVADSLRIVPGTGTANVRDTARAWYDANVIHLLLPARVPKGSSYTPPSLQFELQPNAPPGLVDAIQLDQFRVTANVFLLGDRHVTCNPVPRPYPLASIRVR